MATREYAFHRVFVSVGGFDLSDYGANGKVLFKTMDDEKYTTTVAADGNPFFAFINNDTLTAELDFMDKGEGYRIMNAMRLAYWNESRNGIPHPIRKFILDDFSEQTLVIGDIVFTSGINQEYAKANTERNFNITLVSALRASIFCGSSMGPLSHNYIEDRLKLIQGAV
jgi:hypothetical protein